MKIFRLALALVLALSLMTFATGSVLAAGTEVDQTAEITLVSKVGATGDAELRLKIDEEGVLDRFRIKVDAESLVAGGTYSLFLGKHLIATGMADDQGRLSFDEELEMFHKTTLKGLKVHVIYGTMLSDPIVLWGKVMAGDIEDRAAED